MESKHLDLSDSIILDELNNIYIKFPLFQAIKEIPIYNKFIKDSCMKKLGRKTEGSPTMNVVEILTDLMLGKHTIPKYSDLGSPIVDVHINKTLIPRSLVDLRVAINIMTKTTMLKLNLQLGLSRTATILHLADSYTIFPLGVLEYFIFSVDSWEYHIYFIVLETKKKLEGYPLILGRPWQATTYAYIGCKRGDMTIGNGPSKNKLTLYSPAKSLLDTKEPIWGEEEDDME